MFSSLHYIGSKAHFRFAHFVVVAISRTEGASAVRKEGYGNVFALAPRTVTTKYNGVVHDHHLVVSWLLVLP